MTFRLLRIGLICTLLGALFAQAPCAHAQAQASTGQITGQVLDAQGGAIANASVKAVNKQTGLERSVVTNESGLYTIPGLPPGSYTVTAEASGFAAETVEDVAVNVGRASDVNFRLGAGSVRETVTVTAQSLQVTRNEADAFVSQTQIENLPINGRRFQDFVTLTPTAQVDPDRGQISLSGQRGVNGYVQIDGSDYTQPFFGGIRGGERSNSAFTIPQESIREFQVVPAGYAAEFGRSTGGIVNAVTKSGTNELRGSAFYLLRHREAASTNDFFRAVEASPQLLGRKITPVPTQQQFGGSIGGPLRRDRAFFFFAYEQQLIDNPREVFFPALGLVTPTNETREAYNLFSSLQTSFIQTNDAIAGLGRLDFQLNEQNRLSIRYNYSQNKALNAAATGEALTPLTTFALSSNGTERDRTNTGVIQLDTIFGPSTLNEFRFQFSREDRPRLSNSSSPGVQTAVGTFGTRSFFPTTQYDTRIGAANNLSYIVGNHTTKFGADLTYTKIFQDFAFNRFGVFSLGGALGSASTATGVNAILELLSRNGTRTDSAGRALNRFDPISAPGNDRSRDVTYSRQIGNGLAEYYEVEFALFAQDSWRIRPNFTLNYGLRYEAQINPQPPVNNESLYLRVRDTVYPNGRRLDPAYIPDGDKQLAPRLGFAWDPLGNARTVVRGFGGIYYARSPFLLFAGPMNNFRLPPGDLSITLPIRLSIPVTDPRYNQFSTVYDQLKLVGIDLNQFSLGNLPIISPETVQRISAALIAAGVLTGAPDPFAGTSPLVIAPDFHNPRSYQFGLGVEHEIANGWTIGADYNQVNTVYLQRNRDVNLFAPTVQPGDPAQRPVYSGTRPVASLFRILVRESTARSLYQALVVRSTYRGRRAQFNVFYTLARALSDDDNERNATGIFYDDSFNLRPEYNYSALDRRHQFVASPVVFLPFGFEVSSAIRLRSALPIDARVGSDLNNDTVNNDRPYSAPGVPFKRNAFRNRPVYDVDLRLQKAFGLGETRRLVLSAELFNVFNIVNLQYTGTAAIYCADTRDRSCGLNGATNLNFLRARDANGNYLLNNVTAVPPSGLPRQLQVGVRLQF